MHAQKHAPIYSDVGARLDIGRLDVLCAYDEKYICVACLHLCCRGRVFVALEIFGIHYGDYRIQFEVPGGLSL